MFNHDEIRGNPVVAKMIQNCLVKFGYLDPPVDGKWGKLSELALEACGKILKVDHLETLVEKIETLDSPVGVSLDSGLASRIVRYMQENQMFISRLPGSYNIVYLEGMNSDGSLNDDQNDYFNDLRILVDFSEETPRIKFWQSATIEPGRWYINHPMNPSGAAFIAHGQYKAWRVGFHGNNDRHEALVQVLPVTVYRDANKNAIRDQADKKETGVFGINQHWGYDMQRVGKASAGCAVGQYRKEHRRFMELIKSDPRYLANPNYTFYSTFIAGDRLG